MRVNFWRSLWCLWLAILSIQPVLAAEAVKRGPIESQIVSYEDANARPVTKADWGEMRFYYTGETHATRDVLAAVATILPGKSAHKSHRHAMEEYLILVEGNGTWSLDGRESPAKRGDILYAAPWVFHGLTNTGQTPLVFVVVRYNGKGVAIPARPDNRPDEVP